MKKTLFSLLATTAMIGFVTTTAHSQMLTISEVYGGGGNSGSTYSNDFIELYNYGATPIDMSAYALYYASATGTAYTTTNQTILSGTLAAGSYFLVSEAAGAGGTTPLTGVNVVGTLALSGTAGKVVLGLANTVPTYAAGSLAATNTTIIDILGYGPTATQYRGTGPGPATTNTTSDARTTVLTAPTNNATDYVAGAPSPQGTGTFVVGVPEPSTWAALIVGIGALALVTRHRLIA